MAEEESLPSDQLNQLKASLHLTTGKLCKEISTKKNCRFSKELIGSVAELVSNQLQVFSQDLELFSKHAKRTTVNVEDVKLLTRKNSKLNSHIHALSEEIESNQKEKLGKQTNKNKGKKSAAASNLVLDELSN